MLILSSSRGAASPSARTSATIAGSRSSAHHAAVGRARGGARGELRVYGPVRSGPAQLGGCPWRPLHGRATDASPMSWQVCVRGERVRTHDREGGSPGRKPVGRRINPFGPNGWGSSLHSRPDPAKHDLCHVRQRLLPSNPGLPGPRGFSVHPCLQPAAPPRGGPSR